MHTTSDIDTALTPRVRAFRLPADLVGKALLLAVRAGDLGRGGIITVLRVPPSHWETAVWPLARAGRPEHNSSPSTGTLPLGTTR